MAVSHHSLNEPPSILGAAARVVAAASAECPATKAAVDRAELSIRRRRSTATAEAAMVEMEDEAAGAAAVVEVAAV